MPNPTHRCVECDHGVDGPAYECPGCGATGAVLHVALLPYQANR